MNQAEKVLILLKLELSKIVMHQKDFEANEESQIEQGFDPMPTNRRKP